MKGVDSQVTRRAVMAATAIGGLAAAAPAAADIYSPQTPAAEQANAAVVRNFVMGWLANPYDPAREIPRFVADECLMRPWEDQPPITSAKALVTAWLGYMKDGSSLTSLDIHQMIVKGPVVMTVRTDVIATPGKPTKTYQVVGVFVVRDGKIREWTDYFLEP